MSKYSILLVLFLSAAWPAAAATPTQPGRSASTTTAVKPAVRGPQPVARAQFTAKLDSSFRSLDVNHDGFLTLQEINSAQAKEQQMIAARVAARRAQAFARLDTNKDGVISKAEFNAGAPETQLPHPDAGFAKLDSNHDGKVSAEEFRALRLARFDALDTNHDGVVTPQEIQAARIAASRR